MRLTRWQKMQNVSWRLNRERYQKGIGCTMRRGKVCRFSPCAKSLVYLAACYDEDRYRPEPYQTPGLSDINSDTVLEVVLLRAYMTQCECHRDGDGWL